MASIPGNITLMEAVTSITSSLTEGQEITIEGLGTFYFVDKPERPGRNPRTGELTTYKASRAPKIKFTKAFIKAIQPGTTDTSTSASTPVAASTSTPPSVPAPTPAPTPVSVPVSVPVQTAPVLPPPIPADLIAASQAPLLWQIKAPDNSFVEVPSNELSNWGVGANTPIYSVATGWKLAGQVPELVGILK